MRIFDTNVQEIKYKTLKEVIRSAYEGNLQSAALDIPKKLAPGPKPELRCCIYKERAILGERVKLAMGGDRDNPNVVEVIREACDECPVSGILVTDACRGCLFHRCADECPKGAITIVNHRAVIDKEKCIECGKCTQVCPYNALIHQHRPCMRSCKGNAISMDADKKAVIGNDKCVSCGACVYQCPFGAITDKSSITQVISLIRNSGNNKNYRVYAVVAPSVASQYTDIAPEQVMAGIKALGFYDVVEAAWGADMVAWLEAEELAEKRFLTSSCCPAFVNYIKKGFPELAENISHNLSPMAQIARWLQEKDEGCHVVFIGPCIAKKGEVKYTKTKKYVDYAITFEEMQAMFSAKGIDVASMDKAQLGNASCFGRIFARCGGLAEAVKEALKEQGVTEEQFGLSAVSCNGISECKAALLKKQKGLLKENFIEGMACEGGCIGGPACLSHNARNTAQVNAYGRSSAESSISDAIKAFRDEEKK